MRVLVRAVLVALVLPTSFTQAGLLVSDWYLLNLVDSSVNGAPVRDYSIISTVTPIPFTDTRYNAIGDTVSRSTFSFDWSGDTSSFRIEGEHQARDVSANLLQSLSTGHVNFTPMVDSLITLRVQYTYDLPGDYMEGFDTGGVFNLDTDELYAQISHGGYSLGPVSGSFDQTMTAVIPAGCNCEFVYTIRLTTHATSVSATDSGIVELSIVPLPEPVTIIPVIIAALVCRKRARR